MKSNEKREIICQPLFSRSICVFVLILLVARCWLPLAAAASSPTNSREVRAIVFEEVWATIRERYYDANLRGVDWEAQREIYRARAASAADNTEFYRVLKQMVGLLHDSHTRVFAPEEKSDWRAPRVINAGVSVREIENALVFADVEKNSLAERAGIKIGDELLSIDDAKATEIFARRLSEPNGSSTMAMQRLRAAAGVFEGAAGSSVAVCWREAATGRKRCAALRREWKTLPASIRARHEGAILIVAFDAFAPEIVREFYQILQNEMRGVRGIVLDLRQNRGGSTEAMTDIASAFLPENQDLGKFIDRAGRIEAQSDTRRWLLFTANFVRVPTLPVAVLTSTQTASAAEIFTAAMRRANRARVFGTQTCGCVLAIKRQHDLTDGGALEIAELDFQTPDGARLEGIGIAPDESIAPTRRDLIARRDRTLERAVEFLKF
jgi:carboxyl-terminal processing protease